MNDKTVDFVLNAVNMVATHGWKLLPQVSHIVYCETILDNACALKRFSLIMNCFILGKGCLDNKVQIGSH